MDADPMLLDDLIIDTVAFQQRKILRRRETDPAVVRRWSRRSVSVGVIPSEPIVSLEATIVPARGCELRRRRFSLVKFTVGKRESLAVQ